MDSFGPVNEIRIDWLYLLLVACSLNHKRLLERFLYL
jgi:hypothetical protein